MNLNELAKDIHETAVSKGWYDSGERNFGELIALMHSELSESLESYRKGESILVEINKCGCGIAGREPCLDPNMCENLVVIPKGIAVELADTIIRILDYCGSKNIDIDRIIRLKMAYNKTRPYRHGNKKI